MNIGIDIDDTISNTYEYTFAHAQQFDIEILGKNGDIDKSGKLSDHWWFAKMHGWSEEEATKFMDMYYRGSITNIYPKHFAKQVIDELKLQGHKIYLITARLSYKDVDALEVTSKWLNKFEIPYDVLITHALDKKSIAVENQIDIFIDDSFNSCQNVAQAEIKTYIMDSNVNRNLNDEMVERVYSWPQFRKKVFSYIRERIGLSDSMPLS